MLPFRDGALKIATKTGCAVIPVSMNNTAEISENHLPNVCLYYSISTEKMSIVFSDFIQFHQKNQNRNEIKQKRTKTNPFTYLFIFFS